MSKFFVSPTVETNLEVSADTLKQALQNTFPGVQIEDIREGNRLFTWMLTAQHGPLEGYLNRKKQVIVLEGDVRDCAEFAQWYRSLVDGNYELAFYDDSYSHSIPITQVTKPIDLSAPWI